MYRLIFFLGLTATPEPEDIAVPKTFASDPPSSFDVAALDGTAVLHFLSPRDCATFNDYAGNVFKPYLLQQLDNTIRLNIVWDSYIANSLKESTRERRGQGSNGRLKGKTTFQNGKICSGTLQTKLNCSTSSQTSSHTQISLQTKWLL